MKELFFFLLKSGLGLSGEVTKGFPITENEWESIWSQAKKQTVCGFVFAGIEKLPLEMQPPKKLMFKFWSYAEYIRKINLKMSASVEEILKWFDDEGLEPMVIKGVAVGALYDNPKLRTQGDIDLFFHKDYDRVVPIVRSKGVEVKLSSNHDIFEYNGFSVELHHTAFRAPSKVMNTDFSPIDSDCEGYNGRMLNVKANAMLLLIHAGEHFMAGGVGFRHLCDWAMFLRKYEDYPEVWDAWMEVKRQGAERFAIEFTAIAVHYLGLKLRNPEKWIGNSDMKLREKMLDLIFKRGNFAKSVRAKSSFYGYYLGLILYYTEVYPFWKCFALKTVPKKILMIFSNK